MRRDLVPLFRCSVVGAFFFGPQPDCNYQTSVYADCDFVFASSQCELDFVDRHFKERPPRDSADRH